MSKIYLEKLLDPRWQKKRLEILSRDGFECLSCGDGKSTLHVHHLEYVLNAEPWDYPDSNFKTLCVHCHTLTELFKTDGIAPLATTKHLSDNGTMIITAAVLSNGQKTAISYFYDSITKELHHIVSIRKDTLETLLEFLKKV